MQNYETFKSVQSDFKEGLHFGSMEAENAQYIDSISGKLNHLKEVWLSIGTTIVSSDFTKDLLDGIIALSEGIESLVKNANKIGILTPIIMGLGLSFSQMTKGVLSGNMSKNNVFTNMNRDIALATQGLTGFKKATTTTTTAFKSLGGMLLKNIGWTTAIYASVKLLAWGYDQLSNKLHKTAEELKRSEQEQTDAINQNKDKINTLQTVGKEYETLANKAKRTSEEEQRMLELGNELAGVLPEIRIGTDENGNAIISMTDDMEGYIDKVKEAIAQQEKLLLGTQMEQSDNGLKMLTKGEAFDLFGDKDISLNEQKAKKQEDYIRRMQELQNSYQVSMKNAREYEGDTRKRALKDAQTARNKMIQEESKYISEYSKIQSQIMEVSNNFKSEMSATWKDSASLLLEDLTPELEKNIQSFTNAMDFSEISSEEELASVRRIFRELPQLAQAGTINMETLNKQIKDINGEFARTGDLEDYNRNMSELAKSVSQQTGWDTSVLKEMFTVITDGSLKSASSLENFLSAFGKTTQQLNNGDNIAKELQEQWAEIKRTIETINNTDFSSPMSTYKTRIKLETDESLPQQVRDMVKNLSSMGMEDDIIITLTGEVLVALEDGKIDKSELEVLKEEFHQTIQSELGKTNEVYTKEMKMDVNAHLDKLNTKEMMKSIEENLKNGKEVTTKAKLEVEGVEKVKDIDKAIKILEGRPEVYKEIKAVVEGEEDLILFANIIKKLPVNEKYTNKFIVDNKEALSKMKDYKEVSEWINSQPKEFRQKYGLKVEGIKEAKESVESLNKEVKKDKVVEIKTSNGDILDSIKDVETLIDLSAKVEDGKYKIDIDANTKEAVSNIDSLRDSVNELSNQFRNSPITTIKFNVETAQGAKNITGLKNRISEYNKLSSTVRTIKFNTETALASKNVTGLRNNVSSYIKSYAGKSFSTKFNTQTALASQNVTGLRNNVSSYIKSYAGKTFTTTFKVVTNKVNNLVNTVSNKNGATTVSEGVSTVSEFSETSKPMTRESQVSQGEQSVSSYASSRAVSRATQKTPIAIGGKDIHNSMKYSVDLLKELENRISMINNQISLLDTKMEHAIGKDKIKYLEQQNVLYKEQIAVQKELEDKLIRQKNYYEYFLKNKGFQFTSDGNLKNYEEKLIAMEKELKRLEDIAEAKQKAESNYKGENDGHRNKLSKEYEQAKEKADKYSESLEEIKKYLNEYIDVSMNKLPNVKEEFEDINNAIKDNVNAIKDFQNELKELNIDSKYKDNNRDIWEVQNKLDKNEVLLNGSIGSQKEIDLLNERIKLIKQLQKEQNDLLAFERKRREELMKELSSSGFKFRDDGSIENYGSKIRELKETLTEKDFDKVFSMIEDYLDTTYEKIPDLEVKWESLNNEIKENEQSIKKLNEEIKELWEDSKYKDNDRDITAVQNMIDRNEILLKYANGEDKLKLLKEQIELIKQLQKENKDLLGFENKRRENMMKELGEYGFKFRDDGSIEGYGSKIEELKKTLSEDEFNKVFAMIENYIETTYGTIPGLENDILDLNNTIKDAYKEQLEVTQQIQDKITDIYKKEVEERKKLIDEELKKRVDALNKEKEAYNDSRKEADYNREYDDQQDIIKDLQKKIEIASRDTSLSGQKKLQELMKQLEEEQRKLQDMVQDKIDQDVNDMYDKETDRLQEEADKAKEDLDDKFSDEKIQELVKKALNTGVFESIDGTMRSLQDVMLKFVDEYGEGLGATGDIIKNELVTNLEIAKDTMKDIINISKELGLVKYSYSNDLSSNVSRSIPQVRGVKTQSPIVNFHKSLINIEGNVDKNIVDELRNISQEIEDNIISNIVRELR